jgi:precorrin-6Y C5,15-methyltransferase (decarboxylating)
LFTNEVVLSWLRYFSENAPINLVKLKMLDITGNNKNLIPTVMCNRAVGLYGCRTSGHLYDMWNAELGDCDIWYNEGSNPTG